MSRGNLWAKTGEFCIILLCDEEEDRYECMMRTKYEIYNKEIEYVIFEKEEKYKLFRCLMYSSTLKKIIWIKSFGFGSNSNKLFEIVNNEGKKITGKEI